MRKMETRTRMVMRQQMKNIQEAPTREEQLLAVGYVLAVLDQLDEDQKDAEFYAMRAYLLGIAETAGKGRVIA